MHGYDRLHNIHLGIVGKVIESLRKTLTLSRDLEAAARWQVAYLAYAQANARFSNLRIFASIDSKRNFDDNNSFMVMLPLLFPPFLFQRAARTPGIEEHGGTEVLMALVTFVQLTYPAQESGISSTQLDMLQQMAHRYFPFFRAYLPFLASFPCIGSTAQAERRTKATTSALSYTLCLKLLVRSDFLVTLFSMTLCLASDTTLSHSSTRFVWQTKFTLSMPFSGAYVSALERFT